MILLFLVDLVLMFLYTNNATPIVKMKECHMNINVSLG